MSETERSARPVRTDVATRPTTEDKVRFLTDPGSYPHAPAEVRVEETHMSWVFLAGDRVYKLKKPVRYPFLDFSTLEAREHFVREEVRLNRRLAPDVYLAATPLSLDGHNRLTIGPAVRTVDWLVAMRRLPADRMLDRLIAAGSLTPHMVDRLADRLSGFFETAAPQAPPAGELIGRFRDEQAETAAVLKNPVLQIDGDRMEAVLHRFDALFARARPLLEARVRAGRIVDGHGDLRPEHICMTDPIAIIDCLEFNPGLRLVDPFEELAFLGVECALSGADWVFPILYRRCATRLGDRPPDDLVRFYWSYRALLRARLSIAHLLEPHPRTPEKWRPLARRYIALAEGNTLMPPVPSAPSAR